MKIQSNAVVLMAENIDTDQIIPAEFLKQTHKMGLGKHLFQNWRYTPDGKENQDFVLNQSNIVDAKILITGHNFGCGSSREHAAWALVDYGFQAIISSGFADIFKGNAYNNNLLPIELTREDMEAVALLLNEDSHLPVSIDLNEQTISFGEQKLVRSFAIDPFKKECILSGTDETTYLIKLRNVIEEFEKTHVLLPI